MITDRFIFYPKSGIFYPIGYEVRIWPSPVTMYL